METRKINPETKLQTQIPVRTRNMVCSHQSRRCYETQKRHHLGKESALIRVILFRFKCKWYFRRPVYDLTQPKFGRSFCTQRRHRDLTRGIGKLSRKASGFSGICWRGTWSSLTFKMTHINHRNLAIIRMFLLKIILLAWVMPLRR